MHDLDYVRVRRRQSLTTFQTRGCETLLRTFHVSRRGNEVKYLNVSLNEGVLARDKIRTGSSFIIPSFQSDAPTGLYFHPPQA